MFSVDWSQRTDLSLGWLANKPQKALLGTQFLFINRNKKLEKYFVSSFLRVHKNINLKYSIKISSPFETGRWSSTPFQANETPVCHWLVCRGTSLIGPKRNKTAQRQSCCNNDWVNFFILESIVYSECGQCFGVKRGPTFCWTWKLHASTLGYNPMKSLLSTLSLVLVHKSYI